MRTLLSLLSPVYWVTATEIGEAANGLTLTEGTFRRESHIQFSTGEHLVTGAICNQLPQMIADASSMLIFPSRMYYHREGM